MTITLFGVGQTPTDNGTNTTDPTAVAPPANMVAGDLVLLYGDRRASSGTITISETGGQTWTSQTQNSANTQRFRLFTCIFNGTWTANPSITMGATACNSAVMLVFHSSVGSFLPDVAIQNTSFAAPTTPFTVTVTGQTISSIVGSVAVASWSCPAANTFASLSGAGWSKTSLSAQYRNTSGSDQSISLAYFIGSGATGDVSQNESAGTAGVRSFISFKETVNTTSNKAAFLEGAEEVVSSTPAYEKGQDSLSGNNSAYTNGVSLSVRVSMARVGVPMAGVSVINSVPVFMEGQPGSAAGSQSAFLKGSIDAISDTDAFLYGQVAVTGNQGAYLSGPSDFALSVTTPVSYRVFQRSGTTGTIAITGTYTGTAEAIEASFNGGAYQTISASPSGGTFSGNLTGQTQGQGTLTVRGVSHPEALDTVTIVGIGDVYLVGGQSNATGQMVTNKPYFHPTLKAGLFGNDYNWKQLADPFDSNTNQVDTVSSDSNTGGSVWLALATYLMQDQGVPVAFVPCPIVGSVILSWQPGTDHQDRTTLYGSMVYRGLQTGAKAVLWWQGESDAVNAISEADYNTRLDALANAINTDLGIKIIPCKIFILDQSPWTSDNTNVNNAIGTAWGDNSNVIPGPDFSDVAMSKIGGIHYGNDVVWLIASRWYQAIRAGFSWTQQNHYVQSALWWAASNTPVTFEYPVTSGNLVVVAVTQYGGTAINSSSISDNQGNTYHLAGTVTSFAGDTSLRCAIYYAYNVTGGSVFTVTCTANGTPSVAIHEYTGFGTSDPYDKTATGNSSEYDTAISTGNTSETAQNNELLIGLATSGASALNYTVPGSLYTVREEFTSPSVTVLLVTEDREVSATGTYAATFTQEINIGSMSKIVTFKFSGTPTTSSQDAFLSGNENALSSAPVYLKGQDTSSSSRAVFISGSENDLSSENAYLSGQNQAFSNQIAYLLGGNQAASNLPTYLVGQSEINIENVPAFMAGTDTTQGNTPGYLAGDQALVSSQAAYTHGFDQAVSNVPAFLLGSADGLSFIPGFIQGQSDDSSSISSYLFSEGYEQSSIPVYLSGHDQSQSNTPAYLSGSINESSNELAYLYGNANEASSTNAFLNAYLPNASGIIAFLVGNDNAVSSSPAFLVGDERSQTQAYLHGSSAVTSNQAAYINGLDNELTNLIAYLNGLDNTQSEKPAFIHGSDDQFANVSGFTTGSDDSISSIPAFILPNANDQTGAPAYLNGYSANASGIIAFLIGVDTDQSTIPAYVYGILRTSQTFYMVGGLNDLSDQPAFTKGQSDEIGLCNSFVAGQDLIADTWSGFLVGTSDANDTISGFVAGTANDLANNPAFTFGSIDVNSQAPAFMQVDAIASGNLPVYVEGYSANASGIIAFLVGQDIATSALSGYLSGILRDSIPAVLHGGEQTNSALQAFLKGQDDLQTNSPALLVGSTDTSSTTSAFIWGWETSADSSHGFIKGQLTAVNNQAAYLNGLIPNAGAVPAFTRGQDDQTDSILAYLLGGMSVQSNVPVLTAGEDQAYGIQHLYIHGWDHVYDNRVVYLNGQLDISDAGAGYLAGQDNASGTCSAFLQGSDTRSGQGAFLSGQDDGTTSQGAFAFGQVEALGNQAAFTEGLGTEADTSTHAYIAGDFTDLIYVRGNFILTQSLNGSFLEEHQANGDFHLIYDLSGT